MALTTAPHPSLAAGWLSPYLLGRVDLSKHQVAVSASENMVPTPWGPMTRRMGTEWAMLSRFTDRAPRLIGFERSVTDTYMLEVGDQYFIPYRNRRPLVPPDVLTAITNGDFTSDITGWTDESGAGSSISHNAANGTMNLNSDGATYAWAQQELTIEAADDETVHVVKFTVPGIVGDPMECRVGTTTKGAELVDHPVAVGRHSVEFTPGSGVTSVFLQFRHKRGKTVELDRVELADKADWSLYIDHPVPQADLFTIKRIQSIDVMWWTQPRYHPLTIKRHKFGNYSWSAEPYNFDDGPWFDQNTTDTELTVAAASGFNILVTASSTEGINDGQGFLPTDVNRLLRIKGGADFGYGIIVAVDSPTEVHIDIRAAVDTTATNEWQIGLYSDTTGFPTCATFHEERLAFAGSGERPQRIDFSASNAFDLFTPGTAEGEAFSRTAGSNRANNFLWLASSRVLLAGTPGAEAKMQSDRLDTPITPTNFNIRFETREGCADMEPIIMSRVVMFVDRHLRAVNELAFSFEADGYVAPDMTMLAHTITRRGLVDWAWAKEPNSNIWCATVDGELLSFTYKRAEDVVAWGNHQLGGRGRVRAVEAISGSDFDETWFVVERRMPGTMDTDFWIEVMRGPYREYEPQEEMWHQDAGVRVDHRNADAAKLLELEPNAEDFDDATWEYLDQGDLVAYGHAPFDQADADEGKVWRVWRDECAVSVRVVGFTSTSRVTVEYLNTVQEKLRQWPVDVWGDPDAKSDVVSGLDHLVGFKVQPTPDGANHLQVVVPESGEITLDAPAWVTTVGLGNRWFLAPIPHDAGGDLGTSYGQRNRVANLVLFLHRTLNVGQGETLKDLQEIAFRTRDDLMDHAPALFSGFTEDVMPGDWTADGSFFIGDPGPMPATILMLVPEKQVGTR